MERLDILKSELAQIEPMQCMAFDIKRVVVDWYKHEINAEEMQG
jgi:hypothetical protein